jgi:hypothetical protein
MTVSNLFQSPIRTFSSVTTELIWKLGDCGFYVQSASPSCISLLNPL